MRELHGKIKHVISRPVSENPIYLVAEDKHHFESSEAALYFPQDFDEISAALSRIENWCEILPLHMNVKACTYSASGDELILYLGRKFYQSPDDAYQLVYQFKTISEPGYFSAIAIAEDGPLGTSDYHIEFEIVDIMEKSFVRIHISEHQSWISSKAMDVYLATRGATKEGVSVVGHDAQGRPVYSSGKVAVAERNMVRYYFAFDAFFNSASEPDFEKRHEAQISSWYENTEKYPQLHELDRDEYLSEKRQERKNQVKLQSELH